MGDSDDEYDRKRRDKFRGERPESYSRGGDGRRDDRRGGGGGGGGGRDEWPEREWSSRSRTRPDYRDYRGGGGGSGNRDRYSPVRSQEISSGPPLKRMRGEWDDRPSSRYAHSDYYMGSGGGGDRGSSWAPPSDHYMPHHSNHHYGGGGGGGGDRHSNNNSNNRSEVAGNFSNSNIETQPPMMTFKAFLVTQEDSITDEEAIKRYNEYKQEFRRQQLNEFFVAHKDEEWFKIKYHPEESIKRKEEQIAALKKRVEVFLELLNSGEIDKVSVDVDQSTPLLRLLDTVVIKLEGGTEEDLKILEETTPAASTTPVAPKEVAKEPQKDKSKDKDKEKDKDKDKEKDKEVPEVKKDEEETSDKPAEEPMETITVKDDENDNEEEVNKQEDEDNDDEDEDKPMESSAQEEKPVAAPKEKGKKSKKNKKSKKEAADQDDKEKSDGQDESSKAEKIIDGEEDAVDNNNQDENMEISSATAEVAASNSKKRKRTASNSSSSSVEDNDANDNRSTTSNKSSASSNSSSSSSSSQSSPDNNNEENEENENEVENEKMDTADNANKDEKPETVEEKSQLSPSESADKNKIDDKSGIADEEESKNKDKDKKEDKLNKNQVDAVIDLVETGEEDKDEKDSGPANPPRALHKTSSIFLRNLAPTITKAEVEAMCKRFPGFLRVAIADPQPERRWFRRGWVSFERQVNIKEICWSLNNIRLRECELGAIVNRDLLRRIRTVNGITAHKQIVRFDIKLTAKIIHNLDAKIGLWVDPSTVNSNNKDGEETAPENKDANKKTDNTVMEIMPMEFGFSSKNPILKNITDYLIEEASAEEEELLGRGNVDGGTGSGEQQEEGQLDGTNENSDEGPIDRDPALTKVLDRLILYLRIVHSVDYYNHCEYPNEDEMPNRCGIMHVRGPPPQNAKVSFSELQEYCRNFESKMTNFLAPVSGSVAGMSEEEFQKLGAKNAEAEVEKFVQANTQELAKDKWLCPLSGKKFKGPDFIRKHIFNKHAEKVAEVKAEAEYFNNYLKDPKRPILPEHPGNKAPAPSSNAQGPREGLLRDSYPPFGGMGGFGGYGGSNFGSGRGIFGSSGGGYGGFGAGFGGGMPRPSRGGFNRGRNSNNPDFRPVIHYRDLDAPREPDEFL